MKSRPTRTVVRSRRGLGLARMLVGSGPARDPGSLDPSEAPERLCDLFNHEGASFVALCFSPEREVA
jgi:hypothetical protein